MNAVRPNRGGRPRINDHIPVCLFVEHHMKRLGLKSVRQLTQRRDIAFGGATDKTFVRHPPLQHEALRRRYTEAKHALFEPTPHGIYFVGGNPYHNELRQTLEELGRATFG